MSRIDYGNGVYTEYQYDLAGRTTSVVNRSAATVHSSFAYAYDTAGRIQSMTTPQGTATYTYDADGQLTGATLPGHSVQYTYDAAGNRITATEDGVSTAYTTNAAGPVHRCRSAGAQATTRPATWPARPAAAAAVTPTTTKAG